MHSPIGKTIPIDQWVSTELQQAIGSLFIAAGLAETALAIHVLRMMAHPDDFPPQSIALVGGMEVNVKISIIRLYSGMHCGPKVQKEISKLLDSIRTAFTRRNDFAHAAVTPTIQTDVAAVQFLKLGPDGRTSATQEYSAEQIRGFAQAIVASVRALDDKLTALGFRKFAEWQRPNLRPPSR